MGTGSWGTRAAQAGVVVLLLALVTGQLLGQPVLFAFVETGSMAPTLDAGDGFVAVPAAVAGPVEPGDVVTYRAETVDGGGLTTHRVVERTDQGYVTRGDANPFTDQSAGEPPVKNAQVVAVAWRPGGSVLVLPAFGAVVDGIRDIVGGLQRAVASLVGASALLGPSGVWWLVAGFSAVLYLVDLFATEEISRDSERRTDRESGRDARALLAGFALLLVAGATVAMVAPAGTTEYEIVSAEFESEQPTIVRAGNATTLTQPVRNTGIVPVRVYVATESGGVTVRPERFALGSGDTRNVTVTAQAPPETGLYRQFVTEHRYLLVLPSSVLDTLYAAHPWLPLLAVDAVIGVGFYLLGRVVVGRGRVAIRKYERDSPSGGRSLFRK